MFSKSNFGLTDSIIEASRKVSEDYQEKVKGLMAKMGISSLKDLSPEEKKKFFNKLDTMHKAKHEEVELDEAEYTYTVVHAKKGKEIVKASSSYGAAKKFAQMKGLKSTAGVNAHLMKEEEELDEALTPKDKKVVDAFYSGKSMSGKMLSTDGKKLEKTGMGGQTIATKSGTKFKVSAKMDSRSTQSVVNYIKKSFPKNVVEEVEQVDEISKDLAKSYAKKSMKDIVKKQHSTGTVNTSKRFAGLDRAKKRIVKDDLDLEKMADELAGASKMHKGQSERIKKHLKKMDTKTERTLTPGEKEKKEKIVMSLKDKAADFEKRYPGKGKQVMYAVATKMAKKD